MYQSGFMNRSHFYKELTKRMGVAPKGYRLHNKKKKSYKGLIY